jgi:transcription elongation GreA/GreB family factor
MNPPVDKVKLALAVRSRARHDLEVAVDAQRNTVRGATHEESKPENDKDTRAIEASYLARGQAARVEQLREAVALLEALDLSPHHEKTPIRGGSLLMLEEDGEQSLCFLAPVGTGLEVEVDDRQVRVVSTRAPLGRALLGRQAGDSVEVPTPKGQREFEIVGAW